jgi:CheY-like chemotaxis protein
MRDHDGGPAAGLTWLKGRRVLLAEDNITNQMVATQMLDALGMRVDVANDGAEALEMIERHKYDIYLIDIEMPRVSGLDVIRGIRKAPPPLCEAPVIAVTAYALREHREKIAEAGADGLIPKPLIGIEQFGRDILSFLQRASRRTGADEPGRESRRGSDDAGAAQDEADGAEAQAAGPVSLSVFNALADAIGPDAMTDLLTKIDGDLEKSANDIQRGVAEEDNKAVSAATHVLVSVSGAVGAQNLQRLAQKLNAVANARAEGDIAALGSDVGMQVMMLRSFVQTRVKALAG